MAAVYTTNIVIYTNTTFEQVFVLEDTVSNSVLNLTNYTGSAQLRRYKSSSIAATFTTQVNSGGFGKVRIELVNSFDTRRSGSFKGSQKLTSS